MPKSRDPLKDPKPGDVFAHEGGFITVIERLIKTPGQRIFGTGSAKEVVIYRLHRHPGIKFSAGIKCFRETVKISEVVNAAD